MAVHVNESFAPGLEIKEGVGGLSLDIESCTVGTYRQPVACAVRVGKRTIFHRRVCLVLILDVVDFPVPEVVHPLVAILLDCQGHVAGDTLEVLDGSAEIDAAHGLHEDVETRTLGAWRKHQLLLAVAAVKFAYISPLHENLREIMGVVHRKQRLSPELRKRCTVENRAESLVILLHCPDFRILPGLRHIVAERSDLLEVEALDFNRPDQGRHRSLLLAIHIFRKGLAQLPVFGCGLARLAYRRIIVVTCDIGSETG